MIHASDTIVYRAEFAGKSEDLVMKMSSQLVKDNVFGQDDVQAFGAIIIARERAISDTDISMEVLDGHWRTVLETAAAETGQGTDPMLTSVEVQREMINPEIFMGLALLVTVIVGVFALESRK